VSLDPVPAEGLLAPTRRSWHLLAAHVVAEERFRRVGHSGLEPTPGGFRTPTDEPVGVEVDLDQLVVRTAHDVARRSVTTIGDAQAWVLGEVGPPRWGEQPGLHDPPARVPPETPLPIDPVVAAWLGAWFSLGHRVLRELVDDVDSTDAGVPTLWPEHFDVGMELLPAERRASYGVSPGDDTIATPYAYVVPWEPRRAVASGDPRWNDPVLRGASITAGALVAEPDPEAVLLAWFRQRRDLLRDGPG
jgi:hypothetical protein